MTDPHAAQPSHVRTVPTPPADLSPPWDGTHARYTQLRDHAGRGGDGTCRFWAGGQLTCGGPEAGMLDCGDGAAEVPLGARIAVRGGLVWVAPAGDGDGGTAA